MAVAGYSGTPLVKKLGIKPGAAVALVDAPRGFRRELVGLPSDVRLRSRAGGSPDLTLWFVLSKRALESRFAGMARGMGAGLWIAWPKKTSRLAGDVTEDTVRAAGLAHGLVDYKVCAINDTWSGLKFARRKQPLETRGGRPARS